MKIMKILNLLFLLSVFASIICGQSSDGCTLRYEQLPLYKGIRIGMTALEVSKALGMKIKPEKAKTPYSIVPGSEDRKPQNQTEKVVVEITASRIAEYERYMRMYDLGVTKSTLDLTIKPTANLSGVTYIQLSFYKEKLYSFTFDHTTVKKKDGKVVPFLDNVKETIADVSAELNFPNNWQFIQTFSELKCENFTANVIQSGITNISFIIEDVITRNLIKEQVRKTYLDDIRKHPFKPDKNQPPKPGEPIPLKH